METDLVDVVVTEIVQRTPKIKTFKLSFSKNDYQFKPGQWIDLYAPIAGKNIGGYTIISSPLEKNFIELAIRQSDFHPVTKYMHEILKLGDPLRITEGQGRFFLEEKLTSNIIFIAGGIGITPILSMIRSLKQHSDQFELFYSASFESDFLMGDELKPFCQFFVTKDPSYKGNKARMKIENILNSKINYQSAQYFICGPKEMIDSFVSELLKAGVDKMQLHYEKWW